MELMAGQGRPLQETGDGGKGKEEGGGGRKGLAAGARSVKPHSRATGTRDREQPGGPQPGEP